MIHVRQLWFDFEISHALVFAPLAGGRDWGRSCRSQPGALIERATCASWWGGALK